MATRIFSYKGKEYTINGIADLTGMSYTTVSDRLKQNKTVEEIINEGFYPNKKIFIYKNKKYTVKDIARLKKMPMSTIYSRLNHGETIKQIIEKEPKRMKPHRKGTRLVFYKGKFYSIKDIANMLNVSDKFVRYRLNKNMSIHNIITDSLTPRGKLYKYRGRYYTMMQLANELDVNYSTLRCLFRKHKNIEKAIELSMKNRYTFYEYQGKKFSIVQLSKLPECVIGYRTLVSRLKKNWSVEKALTQPAGTY